MFQFRPKAISWKFSFLILFILLSGTSNAVAKEYALFYTGSDGLAHPAANYDWIVGSLKKGDVVRFTDGKSFQLIQDLHGGQGSMSRIFSIKAPAGAAIRLPRQSNPLFLDMITRSINGYQALHEAAVPVVSVQGSKRGEYLLVDQIQTGFMTADAFFREPNQVSRSVRDKMVNRLIEFARTTAFFRAIGDFSLSQIAYDASVDRWVLLDWTASHETIQSTAQSGSKSCFEHVFEPVLKNQNASRKKWIQSVQNKIDQAIREQQRKIRSSSILRNRLKQIEEKISNTSNASAQASGTMPSIQTGFMDCMISNMHHTFDF